MVVKDNKKPLRVGVKLLQQLSSTFYINTRMVFDELISNARDAFATEVRITIEKDKIVLEDNGEGMDDKQLVKFFYISHTGKKTGEEITKGSITRNIIGKFGVGKLAMYQICDWFEIESWKRGVKASSKFDFSEIEKKEFIDEIELNVQKSNSKEKVSGTRITMHKIRKRVIVNVITAGLSKTMPLTSDFSIYVNNTKLEAERRQQGYTYDIDEKDVKVALEIKDEKNEVERIEAVELGDIRGTLLYTKKRIRDYSGIYVRVFGRLVNENPRTIIDLGRLTSSKQFVERTHFEVEVNSLNDALLTSRSGFLQENNRYLAFKQWAFSTLNKYNRLEAKRYKEETEKEQRHALVNLVVPRVKLRLSETFKDKKKFAKAINQIEPIEKLIPKEYDSDEHESLEILGEMIVIEVGRLGVASDECVIGNWSRGIRIIVNEDHPLFFEAKRGSFLQYHAFKAILITIACNFASTLREVKTLYNKLIADKLEAKIASMMDD